jgi:hypothetical protein
MNTDRESVTGSIETDRGREAVIQVLSDPRRIPQWASALPIGRSPTKADAKE